MLEKIKVLIIEDNEDLNQMFQMAFESKDNFEVEISKNGLDGITKAAEMKPNIILLDIMMPQMNGYEVLKALKNNTSIKTTVIINSNLEQKDEEREALDLGADYYLKKSEYTPFQVVEKVEEIVNSQQGGSASETPPTPESDV